MKLATFLADGTQAPQSGEVRGDEVVAFASGTVLDRLAGGDRTPADGAIHALADVTELGSEKPEKPLVFLKLPLSSVPPAGPVKTPKATQALDYEVELVLVMGAENAIAGYAVANDVSARDLQRSEAQWSRAKGFDSSCPWGPWITTADAIDPSHLRLTTDVNGERRQDGSTSDLIFKPDELVEFISEACTLEPGALILTGTPSGVGEAFKPPKYLQPGDTVRCEVEGLGVIEHPIT
jgi:acylpyruvate hydrolase